MHPGLGPLLPGGAYTVVTAVPEFAEDVVDGDALEDLASFVEHEICADDLEEFVHRFWLENMLWKAANSARALTAEEAAYLAHAQARRAR